MMPEWWMLAALANVVMVVIYAFIAGIMIRGIQGGHQWRTNPVAVATAAVFVSCTVGHGLHLVHVLPPFATLMPDEAAAARAMFSDPRLIGWDVLTGSVAIVYWTLRQRLAIVYQGAALNEDLKEREHQAAILRSRVVEGLDHAQAQFEAGERDAAMETLDAALEAGKDIISVLAGRPGHHAPLPGDLRRRSASH